MLNSTKLSIVCAVLGNITASSIAQPLNSSAAGGTFDVPAEVPTGIASALYTLPTTSFIPVVLPTKAVQSVSDTPLRPRSVVDTTSTVTTSGKPEASDVSADYYNPQRPPAFEPYRPASSSSPSSIPFTTTHSTSAFTPTHPTSTSTHPTSTSTHKHTRARRQVAGERLALIIVVAIIALCVLIAAAPCVYWEMRTRAFARDEEQSSYARALYADDGSLAQSLSARYAVVDEQPRGSVLEEKSALMEETEEFY
ncbi:hypothetical protein FA95DRAFT_1609974 [Auriscalpium vulgare]|uniref:Uncharacterized protein n=1 Tax=Auriscalpium vulgare TaxID=40419 RepID=A0ACB8RGH8_9AGAM|nr:hypothetical protein FA95DRAFT_1609974 [Auriscalpium vulgare]